MMIEEKGRFTPFRCLTLKKTKTGNKRRLNRPRHNYVTELVEKAALDIPLLELKMGTSVANSDYDTANNLRGIVILIGTTVLEVPEHTIRIPSVFCYDH